MERERLEFVQMTFAVKMIVEKSVSFLKVVAKVRYWEDATVNGRQDDDESPEMPFATSLDNTWAPTINLETGKIENWPAGTIAGVHYKVCDEGVYTLLDADRQEVAQIDGYVPSMMSPGGAGYGDYIIMDIGPDGQIANWRVDLEAFQPEDAA